MEDILYKNSVADIRIKEMVNALSNKDKELPNLIILTILSAGANEITPVFPKDNSEVSFTSINDIGTRFILDGKEITSEAFLIIEGKETEFGLLFEDSNEHTLKISLIDSTILPYIFYGNNFLIKVVISNSITSIGDSAFWNCRGLTEITIGDSVTTIGMTAFSHCTGLTTITIPNSVTSIGSYAFQECKDLISVIIGNSVTSIGSSVFMNCSGLTSVTIPNSVTEIGSNVFMNCSGLTLVVIGNSVTYISNSAFSSCWNLTSITSLATTAPAISSSTFQYIKNNGTLYIPEGSDYSTWMSTGDYYLGKYNWRLLYLDPETGEVLPPM